MKALLDTNVIVDVLQKREPLFAGSSKIIIAAADNRLQGYVTSKEIAGIHFFFRRQFAVQENTEKNTSNYRETSLISE